MNGFLAFLIGKTIAKYAMIAGAVLFVWYINERSKKQKRAKEELARIEKHTFGRKEHEREKDDEENGMGTTPR